MKVELFQPVYGDDLMVVNTARVSFSKASKWITESFSSDAEAEAYAEQHNGQVTGWDENYIYTYTQHLSDADKGLIRYLARGLTAADFDKFLMDVWDASGYSLAEFDKERMKELLWEWRRTPEHFAPFAHPQASFRITAPIAIARQLSKHQVGMVWSEVSRRYVDSEPEFYFPEKWRKAADNVKQGSSDEAVDDLEGCKEAYDIFIETYRDMYGEMLHRGVCPEQARMVLPQSMMTTWIWTGSLYGWANVYNKRKPGSHAQRECWPIAEEIAAHMKAAFPVSWEALTNVP